MADATPIRLIDIDEDPIREKHCGVAEHKPVHTDQFTLDARGGIQFVCPDCVVAAQAKVTAHDPNSTQQS